MASFQLPAKYPQLPPLLIGRIETNIWVIKPKEAFRGTALGFHGCAGSIIAPLFHWWASYRVFSRPVAWPVVTMETVGQTNQLTVPAGAQALSAHYIMLIRPLQALPLVRIYRKLFISNIFFNCKACLQLYVEYIRKKKKIHRIFLKFKFFVGTST